MKKLYFKAQHTDVYIEKPEANIENVDDNTQRPEINNENTEVSPEASTTGSGSTDRRW